MFGYVTGLAAIMIGTIACCQTREAGSAVILVFGDGSHDAVREFVDLEGTIPDSEVFVADGSGGAVIPYDGILVWFGDLDVSQDDLTALPDSLRISVERTVAATDQPLADMEDGSVVMGRNCIISYFTDSESHNLIAVNLSGADPHLFCRGSTMSYLLQSALGRTFVEPAQ